MKKLITVVLLALSLTTIKISAAQERIYYDFTYGDNIYYDLDTGLVKSNERFAVTNRNRVRSDKIWIVGNNYHHIVWWGENNLYLGYHNSANASYQNDKYLGDVTLFVTPPEGAKYFHLQVCKERDNLIDFIEYPPQGALEVIDKNSFSFTDYAGPVNHEVIYEDLDDGYAPRMVLEYGHTYYIRYSLVKLAELLYEKVFYGGASSNTVIKADLDDLSTLNTSPSYGGTIYSIAVDDTHIYVGGATTQKVRKYLKSDLSYVGETPSYGGEIRAIAVDDTYIYVGGVTTRTVRKYLKSNLSYVGESPSYGGDIYSIAVDDTYVYVGGQTTQTVRKYLKSDLSYVGETPDYGGTIYSIAIDDTYIYVGGQTTQTVRKYLKSDLSYVGETPSYGGTIYSIAVDDTYIYVGGRIPVFFPFSTNMVKNI